jgi:hypothetical protein
MGLGTKMLSFKELIAVDYTGTGDPQLIKNAKRRKDSDTTGQTESVDISDQEAIESLDESDKFDMELKDLLGLDEAVLTPAQRARRAQLLRRSKAKIKLGKMIASRRLATKATIQKRAKRRARGMVLKKLLKNRSKSDLSYSARGGYEAMLSKRKGMTDRLVKRIAPKVRRDDVKKFQNKSK